MDSLIAFAIVIIAVAIMRGKPIKIEIKHTYPQPTEITTPDLDKEGKQTLVGMAEALSNLNDIMTGGDNNAGRT